MSFINAFTNRTFGIEMEFVNNTYTTGQIANKITEAGVECYAEYYNHTTRQWWKIVTDASCGFELVSPPLSGAEAFEQIKIVCKVLDECGSKVNKKCGLHIHHGANDFTIDTFKNLFNLYVRFESTIDSMMPTSRRDNNNSYCRSMRGICSLNPTSRKAKIDSILERIKDCTTVDELRNIYSGNRYHKLNAEAYVKHGTIEFRQHSGTLDAEKIINWVIFTQAMINAAFAGMNIWAYNPEKDTINELLKKLRMIKSYTNDEYLAQSREFVKARIKHFRKEEVTAA